MSSNGNTELVDGKCIPEIGCLVNGLFLDGAAWCPVKNHLIEPKNGILFDQMVTVSRYWNAQWHSSLIGCYILTQKFTKYIVNRANNLFAASVYCYDNVFVRPFSIPSEFIVINVHQ